MKNIFDPKIQAQQIKDEAGKAEFNELTLEILQCAVFSAKEENIRSVDSLRKSLLMKYPGEDAQISLAISTWARQMGESHRHNPPSPAPGSW